MKQSILRDQYKPQATITSSIDFKIEIRIDADPKGINYLIKPIQTQKSKLRLRIRSEMYIK